MNFVNTDVTVKRLTGAIGAELSGIELTGPDYDNIFPAVHEAFLENAVVVLRGQDLDPAQLVAFSKKFGKLESHVLSQFNNKDHPEVLYISNVKDKGKPIGAINAGQYWHSDLSYMNKPTQASLLHSKEIPSYGGDTMFANLYLAYETLGQRIKDLLEGLEAVHDVTLIRGLEQREPEVIAEMKQRTPPVIHPIIRVHPETGRKSYMVGERIRGFVPCCAGDVRGEDHGADFSSRFFGPAIGLDEDPVTGSAHCALAPLFSKRGGKTRLVGYQASARGGEVVCDVDGPVVRLSGRAVAVMRGSVKS